MMLRNRRFGLSAALVTAALLGACTGETVDTKDALDTEVQDTDVDTDVVDDDDIAPADHGPYSEAATGPMGSAVGWATEEQLATFERGHEVALHRFSREEGLGPAFNITFCAACHEKPLTGGSAGMYRNFYLSQVRLEDGVQFPGQSAGSAGGVIRLYQYGGVDEAPLPARPEVPAETNVIAQRNPIPFFGTGLLAEIPDDEILQYADPDDLDGDGISGRPNYDRGFVGRFGMKSQTVSIEGFIRGPLFNHAGVTTDPLTQEQKAALPVDSSNAEETTALNWLTAGMLPIGQAAAPDGPLNDEDGVMDPEMTTDELFDLVSFAMLLAAPAPEPLTELTARGTARFDAAGCGGCHIPRLESPRGLLPIYSDLLLHDMGDELADGLMQGEATGSEFRTQPLWGVSATGPFLHDGRATTIEEAILWHGGEGAGAREAYKAMSSTARAELEAFVLSLGGRDQATGGLLLPDQPIDPVGAWGGPAEALSPEEADRFLAGRALFDFEFGFADGLGGPRFNGDSCRACHFEPVFGGAGPRGVNVIRHGILNGNGDYVQPSVGSILHRGTAFLTDHANRPQPEATFFEHRQTPHLFGLGAIDALPEAVILAGADPYDEDGDGISGKASWTDGDLLGRFGWKAQVPNIDEFIRDAVTVELGLTMPLEAGLTFGRLHDNDDVPDPEITLSEVHLLGDYLRSLAWPPRSADAGSEQAVRGEAVFSSVGCASCHTPALVGNDGPVPLYSDLLLHEIVPQDRPGIEEASATMFELRTPPLWGVRDTAPYLHHGEADTLADAVVGHAGEALAVVAATKPCQKLIARI